MNNLIILSYHKFVEEESDYVFSRTFKQFKNDLETKDFDLITIDDAKKGTIKACEMMREKNFRAKIFVSTALIGTEGFCTWGDIWKLSRYHDVESHSHQHVTMNMLFTEQIEDNIRLSVEMIKNNTGRRPRYFVAPYNTYDERIDYITSAFGLITLKDRITIKNDSR